jgi:hypothetical protein
MTDSDKPATRMKALGAFDIKDADKGEVEAVIATLGVVDRDGDIIRKDAIANGAKVTMSSYGHDAVYGNRPVGKGALSIVGNKVIFKGRVFLNTTDGRDTFEVLKEMGADQEWSFGYRVMGWEVPSDDEQKSGASMILTKLDAFEVSPVLVGAGIGTQTLGVKQADGDPGGPEAAGAAEAPAPMVEVVVEAAVDTKAVDDTAIAAERIAAEQEAEAQRVLAAATKESERINREAREIADRVQFNVKRYGGV